MILQGKTAFITGASRGIGKDIATLFASEGADLILVSRDIESLEDLRDTLSLDYPKCQIRIYSLDVSNYEDVKRVFDDVSAKNLRFNILVNNAGVMIDGTLLFAKKDDILANININLCGTIYVSKFAIKSLIKAGGSSIINLTSIVGVNGSIGQSVYSASKGGVISFTKSLSKELSSLKIRVNAISPGFIETDLVKHYPQESIDKIKRTIGMKRGGMVRDVSNVALFLASPQSEYITGQVIGVDGSMVI